MMVRHADVPGEAVNGCANIFVCVSHWLDNNNLFFFFFSFCSLCLELVVILNWV